MKLKNLFFAGLIGLISFAGCDKYYKSVMKGEEAIVTEKNYNPRGFVYTDNDLFSVEKYTTRFEGKIDFENHEEGIYKKFKVGDLASVVYTEFYHDTLEDIDGDGKKEIVKDIIARLFLNAWPIKDIETEEFFKKKMKDEKNKITFLK